MERSLQVIIGADMPDVEDWAIAGVKPTTLRMAAADAAYKSFVIMSPPSLRRCCAACRRQRLIRTIVPLFSLLLM